MIKIGKVYVIEEEDFHQRKLNLICLTWLYTFTVNLFCLLTCYWSNVAGIVRKSVIKNLDSLVVIRYLCSCILRLSSLTLTPCFFFLGNPRTLYGQDSAFRLSVKCKAPLQKEKKNAGWLLICLQCSLLGCLYYHSSRITKDLMCCISSHLTGEGIPFVEVFLC